MSQPEPGDTFTVEVKQAHLDHGHPEQPRFCAVAAAIEDAGICEDAAVGTVVDSRDWVTCFAVVDPADYLERLDKRGDTPPAEPREVKVRCVQRYDTSEDVPRGLPLP